MQRLVLGAAPERWCTIGHMNEPNKSAALRLVNWVTDSNDRRGAPALVGRELGARVLGSRVIVRRMKASRGLQRTRPIAIVVIISTLTGCAAQLPSSSTASEIGARSEVVQVDRAQVVGFFPRVRRSEVEGDPGAESALEHFAYALAETEKCLRRREIPVRIVYADSIVFEGVHPRSVLELREFSNENIGCAFVAPGREPEFVRASMGSSSLGLLCPATAVSYFAVPECCPEGWKCCPDGSAVDKEYPCPG